MSEPEPSTADLLEGIGQGGRFLWDGLDGANLVGCTQRLLDAGYAVRLSLVGYGMAVRFALTDGRGYTAGWTCASGRELQQLVLALLTPGALGWVERNLVKPQRRR